MRQFRQIFCLFLLTAFQPSWSVDTGAPIPVISTAVSTLDTVVGKAAPTKIALTKEELQWIEKHPEIRIGVMDAWPPFNFLDKRGNPSGIGRDYIAALNQRLGGLLKIVPAPWSDLYEQVKGKHLDALMDITPKPAREEHFNFTTPYLNVPHVIVAPKDTPYLRNEDDLKGKILALERGFGNVKYFEKHYPQVRIRQYRDTSHALGAVARGEADAYAGNRGVALYLAEEEVMLNLKAHGRLRKPGSVLAIGTRKDWPILRDILQQGMDDISQQERRKILSKWITYESDRAIKLTAKEKAWLAKHREIRVGTMNAWPPMDYVDSEGKARGIGASFIAALNERLNNSLKIVPGTWKKIYTDVQEKRLDVLFGITPRPEREQYFHFTKPYVTVPHVIFARKDGPYYTGLKELKDRIVAVERGFFIVNVLGSKYPGIQVQEYESTSDALDAVSKGDADAYVGNRAVAMFLIERELIGNLVQHNKIRETASINAIGVRKDWPILRDILQKALDSLTEKEMRAILRKWVISENITPIVEPLFTAKEKTWLAKHRKMRIGIDSSWPPFEFLDSAGVYHGMVLDFVKLFNERLGIDMQPVKGLNWSQVMEQARNGEIDVLPAVMRSEERARHLNFTQPYLSFPMVILTHKNAPLISGIEGLAGKRVALIKGYITEELVAANHPELQPVRFENIHQALKALSEREVDAYIDNIPAITYAIQKLGLEDLRVAAPTPYSFDLAFGIRKDWNELVGILDKLIDTIPQTEKRAVTQSWLNFRVETKTDWQLVFLATGIVLLVAGTILAIILIWNRRLHREVAWRKRVEVNLKENQQILEQQTNVLTTVLNSISQGLVAFDKDLRLLAWNRKLTEIRGYPPEMLTVGKGFADFMRFDLDNDEFRHSDPGITLDQLLGRAMEFETHHLERQRPDGNVIEILGGPIPGGGFVSTYEDISERKRAEEKLHAANEITEAANLELKKLDQLKSMFIASMSHELRTPLNSIIGFTGIILEGMSGDLNERQKDQLGRVNGAAHHLLNLINDVIDISKIEAQRIDVFPEPLILNELIEEAVGTVQTQLEGKGLTLTVDVPQGMSLVTDRKRLLQCILNFLSNAVKYSDEGLIKISARSTDGEVEITIADNGIGIPEVALKKLFRPFERLQSYMSVKAGGTGLGLYLTKKIATELLQGAVSVESQVGKGSTFCLRVAKILSVNNV